METDFEILCWLHDRLRCVHRENELVDYMHALRRIIAATPPDRRSPPFLSNSLEEMKRKLRDRDRVFVPPGGAL